MWFGRPNGVTPVLGVYPGFGGIKRGGHFFARFAPFFGGAENSPYKVQEFSLNSAKLSARRRSGGAGEREGGR